MPFKSREESIPSVQAADLAVAAKEKVGRR
jgi:hypothetical protein